MSRRAPVLLALIALALGAVAWWALAPGRGSVGARDERAEDRADPAAPGFARVEGSATERAPTLAGAPAGARLAGTGARIHGRVTVAGRDAPPPPGGRVDVRTEDGEQRLVARVALDGSGRYVARIEEWALDGGRRLVVTAIVPGRAFRHERVSIGVRRVEERDLTVGGPERDRVLAGRVLDLEARPVPGLRLLVSSDAGLVEGTPIFDPESEGDALGGAEAVAGVVTTDGEGRFEVTGVEDAPHRALSLDPAWRVEAEDGGVLRPGETTLLARPAAVLEGEVTDAATGSILPRVTRRHEIVIGSRVAAVVASADGDGRFRWTDAIPAGGEAGFDVRFRAGADGFRSAERTLRFAPGRWTQSLEVALERLGEGDFGRLRLLHEVRDATGRPLPLEVTRRDEDAGPRRSPRRVEVEEDVEGFYTVTLPAGAVHLRVVPVASDLGLLAWEGTVTVLGARATDFVVPFPATGGLRLRASGDGEGGALRLVEAGGLEWGLHLGADEVEPRLLPRVPVGRWRVWFSARGEDAAVLVDVVAGTVAEVVVPR